MKYTLKKSLGQHFLKDEAICKQIVETIDIAMKANHINQLLEVGPGAGAITKYLKEIPAIDFKAMEIDTEKVKYLCETYPDLRDIIIHNDFLASAAPFEGQYLVAGNFPYNISSQILFQVIEQRQQIPVVVGMFQKEVAQRVAAKSGSKVYGIISILIQAYYSVEYLFDVLPTSFTPPPKVMSGVIILRIKDKSLNVESEALFVQLVKTAFNQRRKMLRNAVRNLFDDAFLKDALFNKRAEQLTIEDFAALTFRMKKNNDTLTINQE